MKTDRIKLLHLTDPHLRAAPEARLHGWAVDQSFARVLEAATDRHPDFDVLVLGGDLVDDESTAGYRRLNARLRALNRPVLAIAGNHDDPQALAALLDVAHVHIPLVIGGWQLIALNSHRPGSAAGRLGSAQLDALETELAGAAGPALIFVHHPPVALGSAWIDAMGLEDGTALAAAVARHLRVRAIVCGHAHQAAQLRCGERECFVTPSTMRQFRIGADAFAEDRAAAPGYRWLTLDADGTLETGVERCEAAREACG